MNYNLTNMKTNSNLWDKLVSFENLNLAYYKAKKANSNHIEVYKFQLNLERNLFELQNELINRKYQLSKYFCFTIFDPKKRVIKALPFRDRVVQHALVNIIEPIFEKTFIGNSFACRKGYGTHKGLIEVKKAVQGKFKFKGYALKCDVKKYFYTIDHSILKRILFHKIKDKKVQELISLIIDSDCSAFGKNKGIPIGNLTSQLFANIYLNELDQFVKHKLKAKYYYRYVDDFLIFSELKSQLHMYKKAIKCFLKYTLKLKVPNRKANIYLIKDGVDFVGYKIFPKMIRLRKSNIIKFKKRAMDLLRQIMTRGVSVKKLLASIYSYLGYGKHADAHRIMSLIIFKIIIGLLLALRLTQLINQ